ncbi:hypothetical protein NDU88_000852 [Pleurodeles waltl]|uniref:Uncharacterized protein n=1 Tax=Pleurodeles waltl TaxID=8319 RepID=A0AAV7LXR9_PLEWA|nr:hypothetical protein NDU88_000852 [Pleurodeles waltl]
METGDGDGGWTQAAPSAGGRRWGRHTPGHQPCEPLPVPPEEAGGEEPAAEMRRTARARRDGGAARRLHRVVINARLKLHRLRSRGLQSGLSLPGPLNHPQRRTSFPRQRPFFVWQGYVHFPEMSR